MRPKRTPNCILQSSCKGEMVPFWLMTTRERNSNDRNDTLHIFGSSYFGDFGRFIMVRLSESSVLRKTSSGVTSYGRLPTKTWNNNLGYSVSYMKTKMTIKKERRRLAWFLKMLQEQGIQNKNDTIINKYEKTCNNKYIQAQNYKMLKLHFHGFYFKHKS